MERETDSAAASGPGGIGSKRIALLTMGQNSCTCAGCPSYFEPTGSTGRMKELASDTFGSRSGENASSPV
eukprot:3273195-Rhodomonas_salina.1